MSELDVSFRCMGTTVRILGQDRSRVDDARAYLVAFDVRLSRFRPESELCRLNADPRDAVPASALLRDAERSALCAAQATGGVIDPTVGPALERAGYAASMAGATSQPLGDVLSAAPARRRAAARPDAEWSQVQVDDAAKVIRRPVGVRLDLGGTGKGYAADAAARLLAGDRRYVVDCGGDVAVGGPEARTLPVEIDVAHPFTGAIVHTFSLTGGGVATSGIDRRVWRRPDGAYGHHLIDPSTGRSAWTGLVGATAAAPSALEADVLAKAAVLAGPEKGRELLARYGGILFHEGGRMQRVRVPIPLSVLRPFRAAA